VRAEDAAQDVRLVDGDYSQISQEVRPRLVIGQDADVEQAEAPDPVRVLQCPREPERPTEIVKHEVRTREAAVRAVSEPEKKKLRARSRTIRI
jgi:hypothetical protein